MFELGVVERRPRQRDRLDPAVCHVDLAAERLNPLRDRRLAASRWRDSFGGGDWRRGVEVDDSAVRNRGMERLHAGAGHAAVAQVDGLQPLERLKFGETGIRDSAAVEIQIPQLPEGRENFGAGIRDLASQQVQPPEPGHFLEVFDPGVGDLYAVQVQVLHLVEIAQVLQAVVRNQGAEEVQALQVPHFGQWGEGVIEHVGIAEVERLQVDERFEALRILNRGVVEA